MGDFIFVVKCFAVTLAIVVLLQIKIGARTLEGHTMNWIHRSAVVQQLQDVAEGAVKIGKSGSKEVSSLFEDSTDDIAESASQLRNREEASHSWFKVKRSDAYYKQKAREKKQKAAQQNAEKQDEGDFEESSALSEDRY